VGTSARPSRSEALPEVDAERDGATDGDEAAGGESATATQLWQEPAAAAAGTAASIVSVAATGTVVGPGMALVVLSCCVTAAFVTWKHSDP